jgi:hypothetical protein
MTRQRRLGRAPVYAVKAEASSRHLTVIGAGENQIQKH